MALLAAVLLAGASGFVLNRLVMRRIGDIDETARAIVAGDLATRIPVRAGGDEFGGLAVTLNGMLERIEALVTELRTVTDSLSPRHAHATDATEDTASSVRRMQISTDRCGARR